MSIPEEIYIEFAAEASLNSPCVSKRGVAIWDAGGLISVGYNFKPSPFVCDQSEECKRKCSKDAVHAEQAALLFAPRSVRGASMLHVKTVNGKIVPSIKPSCLECSKLILASGIANMWLFHPNGWRRYPAIEFHYLSGADLKPCPPQNGTVSESTSTPEAKV